MNINWKEIKNGGITTSIVYKGYRYIAKVNENGNYTIDKVKSSFSHIKLLFSRSSVVAVGNTSSREVGRMDCEKFFENLMGTSESAIVSNISEIRTEEVKEQSVPIVDTEEKKETVVVEEITPTEVKSVLNTPKIIVDGNNVTIKVPNSSVVRYTTNGKDVRANNKVYKEALVLEIGTVVKAVAFYENGKSEQVEKTV